MERKIAKLLIEIARYMTYPHPPNDHSLIRAQQDLEQALKEQDDGI